MIDITFSYNWNNKLDCKAFTTIRIYNPARHYTGQRVRAVLKGENKGEGFIAAVKPFMLASLNEFMARLDTGYTVEECRNVILKMYPSVNLELQKLALILIVKD